MKQKHKNTRSVEINTPKQKTFFRRLADKKQLKLSKSRISYDGK